MVWKQRTNGHPVVVGTSFDAFTRHVQVTARTSNNAVMAARSLTSNAYSASRDRRRSGCVAFVSQNSRLYILCPVNDITGQCHAEGQATGTANGVFHMVVRSGSRV